VTVDTLSEEAPEHSIGEGIRFETLKENIKRREAAKLKRRILAPGKPKGSKLMTEKRVGELTVCWGGKEEKHPRRGRKTTTPEEE